MPDTRPWALATTSSDPATFLLKPKTFGNEISGPPSSFVAYIDFMGNQDAPNAPAGWYPIEQGKPGERYWDGEAWTALTRGLPTIAQSDGVIPPTRKSRKTVWIIPSGVAVLVLVVAVIVSSNQTPPFITTDEEACTEMSQAIGLVNDQNYGSVAGITSENDQTFNIAKTARAGAGIDAFEGTGNKAQSTKLIQDLSALADSWTLGSDLINSDDGARDSKYDPDYSLYKSNLLLQGVVATCAELGFPLKTPALNFEVPEVAAPSGNQQSVIPEKSKVPAGYTDTGVGIAYMKIDGECDYARCVHYQVYAYDSCPSGVYLEGNQVDANGVIYGMTNDVNGGMNIGDVAVMTLRATNDAATAIKITDASCY